MPDRRQELLRQRALIQEHLAWLDREIAALSGSAATAVPPLPPPSSAPSTIPTIGASEARADEILSEYHSDTQSLAKSTQRGCLLYFGLALLLLGLAVTGVYFYSSRHHSMPPDRDSIQSPAPSRKDR